VGRVQGDDNRNVVRGRTSTVGILEFLGILDGRLQVFVYPDVVKPPAGMRLFALNQAVPGKVVAIRQGSKIEPKNAGGTI
tara:strand:+ start:20 stop:259 length:240 start_codon:yes stop_codon:yes gene_type:complete